MGRGRDGRVDDAAAPGQLRTRPYHLPISPYTAPGELRAADAGRASQDRGAHAAGRSDLAQEHLVRVGVGVGVRVRVRVRIRVGVRVGVGVRARVRVRVRVTC